MDRSGDEEMPPIDGSPLFYFDVEHLRLRNARTGRQCALTRNEALLLEALVAGVCAKPDLIDEVWTRHGTVVTENSYYQLVSLLRKSFASIDLAGTVVTIPRKGLTLHGTLATASDDAGDADARSGMRDSAEYRPHGCERGLDAPIDHANDPQHDLSNESALNRDDGPDANPVFEDHTDSSPDRRFGHDDDANPAQGQDVRALHRAETPDPYDSDDHRSHRRARPRSNALRDALSWPLFAERRNGVPDDLGPRVRVTYLTGLVFCLACVIVIAFRLGAAVSTSLASSERAPATLDPRATGSFDAGDLRVHFARIPTATAKRVWEDVEARIDVPLEQRGYIFITAYRNRYAVLVCSEPPQLWLARCVTVTESL